MLASGAWERSEWVVNMGTSTPGSWPPDSGPDTLPHRSRRRLNVALSIGTGVVVVGGVLWSMFSPSDYTRSHDGCVTITIASSTGAATLHECGLKARALCNSAVGESDPLGLRMLRECGLAGIATSR
jgi:hypothetical protein